MNRKINKKLFYILLSLAIIVVWGSGIYYGQYIKENYQSVSVRMTGESVTKMDLILALEHEEEKGTKEIPSITAWNRLEKQMIENNELNTTSSTRLIEVYGDMKQVCPLKLTEGSLLNAEDYEGCVIDEDVAYDLFRTSDVVGEFLTYQKKQYCIRGIIKSQESMFLIQIDNEDNAYFNLELVYENKENGDQLAKDFIIQNNLVVSYTMIEGCFYARILEQLYQVPAWFLGFYMLYKILKCIWKRRTLPLQVLTLMLGFMVFWVWLKWLMEFQIYIPERLIPTKWSDFSFWEDKYIAFRNQMEQIAYLTPVPKDVILIRYTKRCIYHILFALSGMIVFVTHRKVFLGKNGSIKMGILVIAIECANYLLLLKEGKIFHLTKGYLCILPLFIMSVDIINRGQEYLMYLKSGTK